MTLLDQTRDVVGTAASVFAGTPAAEEVERIAAALEEPLRVALAGRVKAGKSTLLNALVGEELAPTDTGECTRIVTWYRDGLTYRVTLHPVDGQPVGVTFQRDGGPIDVDLGGRAAEDVAYLVIDWPSSSLRSATLIDTPGIGSISTDVSERTVQFLAADDDRPRVADAVLYLMRHMHGDDARFLDAFRDDEAASATPINAIGVLSRADEIGAGRLDAMDAAIRIADRYRLDSRVRRLCQTVVPVAGLLAQAGADLREAEYQAFRGLAALPAEDRTLLLVSVDRFVAEFTASSLAPIERAQLVSRFGLFGVRVAVELIVTGKVTSATQLAHALVEASGIGGLRRVLAGQFAARAEVLKSRSALLALDALARANPGPAGEAVAADVERIETSAHEFSEIRLLNALRTGTVEFRAAEAVDAERLLGVEGLDPPARLGLEPDAPDDAVGAALGESLQRWQRRAESPMSTAAVADAARVLVRTCEGLLAAFAAAQRSPTGT